MQFRRRLKKKTDYSQRLALLRSGKPRLVVRRSIRGFRLQVVEFHPAGDRTLVEVTSGMLKKYGWTGHCGNMPAAYLSGLLIGKEAKKKGIDEAVPDLGMHVSVLGSSLYACLAGARDAGLKVNIGKDAAPKKERAEGGHIAEYAAQLRTQDSKKYARQFAEYLKQGFEPEKIQENFAEVKEKILGESGFESKSKMMITAGAGSKDEGWEDVE